MVLPKYVFNIIYAIILFYNKLALYNTHIQYSKKWKSFESLHIFSFRFDTHVQSEERIKVKSYTWWRHQMEIFYALLAALCAGNSPVTGEFPLQRPVTQSFYAFFDLNIRLSKQLQGWWFETSLRPLWRHCDVFHMSATIKADFTLPYLTLSLVWINSEAEWLSSGTFITNTLKPRQNGCHFAGDIFKFIFLHENCFILIQISLKFILKGPVKSQHWFR